MAIKLIIFFCSYISSLNKKRTIEILCLLTVFSHLRLRRYYGTGKNGTAFSSDESFLGGLTMKRSSGVYSGGVFGNQLCNEALF